MSDPRANGHNPQHGLPGSNTLTLSYLHRRLQSVGHAVDGIGVLMRTQPNARIHFVATILVTAAGLWFSIAAAEWALIAFAVAGVWTAEAFNTSIEFLVDLASPERHPLAGRAKDVAAAGVLVSTCGAVAIGLLVFGPRLLTLLKG